MGTREVIIRFCDCCSKNIEGRLTLHTCPVCHADICVECQDKENAKQKPREPKEKKPKRGEAPLIPTLERISPNISTFKVTIGEGDEAHTLQLGDQTITAKNIREGVKDLLELFGIDHQFVKDAPESAGKRDLLAILGSVDQGKRK